MSLKKDGCDLIIHQGDTAYLNIKIRKILFEINPDDKLIFTVSKRMTFGDAVIVKEVYASDFNDMTATFCFDESDTSKLAIGNYYYGIRYYRAEDGTYYKFTVVADRRFIIKPHTPDSFGGG